MQDQIKISAASEPAQSGPEARSLASSPGLPDILIRFADELTEWVNGHETTYIERHIIESRVRILRADAAAWNKLR